MTKHIIFTRDFILSSLAQFSFSCVFFILIPTVPLYLSKFGAKEAEIGVLVGGLSVASLILRPLVGKALLRIPERRFMIAGAVLFALTSFAYLVSPPFWPFLIVRIIQGVGLAFFSTASITLAANLAPPTHLGQMISYFYLSINIAFALAPSLGIFLINRFDFDILFLVCAGLSLCSLIITLKLKAAQGIPAQDHFDRDRPFLSREALPPSIVAFMGSIMWGALTAFFPLFAISHGVANPGVFFAALATTLILARGLGGKILDTHAREKVILPCLAAQIVAMAVLAVSSTLPMFLLVAVIWGVGNAFLYPSLVAYAIDRAGPSRGPAMGTYMAFSDLGAGMGSVIMGIILQMSGYLVMFLSLVLTGLINLCYFHFVVNKRSAD